jgi:hypothetical protein
MALQIIIVVSSCAAIALLAQANSRLRFWGYLIGLLGQPAWLVVAERTEAWGILLVASWWSAWYAWGLVTHWRLK